MHEEQIAPLIVFTFWTATTMGEKRSACAEREYDYSVGLNAFTVIDSFLYMEL